MSILITKNIIAYCSILGSEAFESLGVTKPTYGIEVGKRGCQGHVVNDQYSLVQNYCRIGIFSSARRYESSATSTIPFSSFYFFSMFLGSMKFVLKWKKATLRLAERSAGNNRLSSRNFSTGITSEDIFVKLEGDLRSLGIKPDTSAMQEKYPTNEAYDIIQPYSKFIMRVSFLSNTILALNAKYGVTPEKDRSEAYRKELLSAITDAKLDLKSIDSTIKTISLIKEVRISETLIYAYSDTFTNIEHERSLFLLNLVYKKFKDSKISLAITSVDQMKAFIRTDTEISDFFYEMKCMFDFAMVLDPVMFDSGVTPEEFKEFIANKKLASKMNVLTQATHKELAKITSLVKTSLIDGTSSIFEKSNWVYKFSKLTREMLPAELNSLVILNNSRVDIMELAYNLTVKAFKIYSIYYYKNSNVDITKIMSADLINHLYGYRFNENSFKEFQETLSTWGSRTSHHNVK